ncbi:AraC-like DNA-binding protein [Wenyingzhuangia heitensis]|uniref:AraC-like DNA-binding protein n=1 Tax=Wenyingzhuangia heitensis TaxID=1487859 RepID=A0ABX0U8B8_9FLAO|nr:AraC family transcriptional regulator [Wenyingzhuangia heitensis]NIJ44180.1 AraC-like DNA-binding protein [Wenyingzhuangia heitensis]
MKKEHSNAKHKELTIDAISKLSGFKSRTTFYSVFKNKTNKTDAVYKRLQDVS